MNIEKVQKSLAAVVLASEVSHVFCCVLPTLFSLASLAASVGLIVAMPAGLEALHELLHDWEIPMILLSAGIVMIGWGVHLIARRLDCHHTGCAHEPCGPRKIKSATILKIATLLLLVNVTIYLFFHHGMEALLGH